MDRTVSTLRRSPLAAALLVALSSPAEAGGVVRVKDIRPGPSGSNPTYLTAVAGTLFFVATDGSGQGRELWASDGSEAGTRLVKDIGRGATYPSSDPEDLTAYRGRLIFTASDGGLDGGGTGHELWVSDGSADGTVLLRDILPGPENGLPRDYVRFADQLFFVANDALGAAADLWRTDGSADGTVKAVDLNALSVVAGSVRHLTAVGDRLFFTAADPDAGQELWVSDGRSARRLLDINRAGSADPRGSFPSAGNDAVQRIVRDMGVVVDCALYFLADDGVSGRELWRSDGTAGGTERVADIAPGVAGSNIRNLSVVDGRVFFTADDGGGEQLWVSDGSAAGTLRLTQFGDSPGRPAPRWLTPYDGRLIFVASEPDTTGLELFESDGSVAGTRLLKDLVAGAGSSYPAGLRAANGRLWFQARVVGSGTELWSSDGSADGTTLISDIRSGGGSYPQKFTGVDGSVFFTAVGSDHGIGEFELYRIDAPGGAAPSPPDCDSGFELPLFGDGFE